MSFPNFSRDVAVDMRGGLYCIAFRDKRSTDVIIVGQGLAFSG
jgi:hypothetical protein